MVRFIEKPAFHIALIAALGLLAYSNTFDVPFQLDENYFIKENPLIKNFAYFLEPLHVEESGLMNRTFKNRCIGYLTFALNYRIHGTDVTGYHIVNLALHILNSFLVYAFLLFSFETPFLKESPLKKHSKDMALITGLLFVSHPVQTEAVTYIFQRFASLVTFFYLLSIVSYIKWRLTRASFFLYLLSLVSAVLAMKTKENAFTLPIVVSLYEFLFFPCPARDRVLRLFPFLLTLFIIPLTALSDERGIIGVDATTRYYAYMPRMNYLLTQFRVMVTYVRLLFFPANQNLDYDYPVFNSFLNAEIFLSFLSLVLLFGFASYLLYRSKWNADLRLISFGIFWFFITLSVESSILPLQLIICEYRVYLPSAGAFIALTLGAGVVLKKAGSRRLNRAALTASVLIIIALAGATYSRNEVWRSELSLWSDVVRKSPGKARPHNNLALAYGGAGMTEKAIEHFKMAIKLDPGYAQAHNNLSNIYASRGSLDEAIEHYEAAVRLVPSEPRINFNLGRVYLIRGMVEKAIRHLEIAVRSRPYYAMAHYKLAQAYEKRGMEELAARHFRIASELCRKEQ